MLYEDVKVMCKVMCSQWMNLDNFLHANTYSGKLKVTLIVIWWAWSNMGLTF